MLCRLVSELMIFGWKAVSPTPRRVLMTIPVVIVPHGADVTRVGFEEKFRHRVDAYRRDAADRTR
jgi:hypothetical protein